MPERCWRRVVAPLMLMLPLVAAAQEPTPLVPRDRVRVTLRGPAAPVHIGAYQTLTDTTLVLTVRSAPRAFPLAAIERVELARGHRLSVVGGVVGGVLGVATGGFVLGCLANRDSYGVLCGGQNDTKLTIGAAVGGVGGALLGAWLFRTERWVPLDPAVLRARGAP